MLITCKEKTLHIFKQGKIFRALSMYIISFSSHQNILYLTGLLKQTVRLPCLVMCYSLCLECPSLLDCWETLNYSSKLRSIMTAPSGPVGCLLGQVVITSPLVLIHSCLLAHHCAEMCLLTPVSISLMCVPQGQESLEHSGHWLLNEIELNYEVATWEG